MTYFQPSETKCKCGCGQDILPALRDALDDLRHTLGFPLEVASGFRCPKRNRLVGGARDSMHLRGLACDLVFPADPARRHALAREALASFSGVGIYETFIHVDLRHRVNRPLSLWVN